MTRITLFKATALALFLANCGTLSGSGNSSADPTDPCGAKGYTQLLGTSLAAATLPADLNDRIIRPGEAQTQDFDPIRLNIEVNDGGMIIGLSCG